MALYAKLKRIYVTFARENFFFLETGDIYKEKNECKSQRNIKRRKSRGKRRERKMEQGATPSFSLRFISIKTEDRRYRNSNPDVGNCMYTHIQETFLSPSPLPMESFQNKKPIFGDGNFIFCLQPCLTADMQNHCKNELWKTNTLKTKMLLFPEFWTSCPSTPSLGRKPSCRKGLRLFRMEINSQNLMIPPYLQTLSIAFPFFKRAGCFKNALRF